MPCDCSLKMSIRVYESKLLDKTSNYIIFNILNKHDQDNNRQIINNARFVTALGATAFDFMKCRFKRLKLEVDKVQINKCF